MLSVVMKMNNPCNLTVHIQLKIKHPTIYFPLGFLIKTNFMKYYEKLKLNFMS